MEQSNLQRLYQGAKFDGRTSYNSSVGSIGNTYTNDSFVHNIPSAGRQTRSLVQNLQQLKGEQFDWVFHLYFTSFVLTSGL